MPRDVYYYSIIRFIPNPVREEALNLGVILVGRDVQFADYRMLARTKTRMRLLAPRFDVRLIESFEDDLRSLVGRRGFQLRLEGSSTSLALTGLRQISETHANQLQFTPPRTYLASEPEAALDDLFEEFVRPRRLARGPRGVVDRRQIRNTIVQAFARWELDPQAHPARVNVQGESGTHLFDYGLRNGSVRVAIHAVSFQMTMAEDVILQRDHVAWAAYDIHQRDRNFPIVAVVSPPLAQNRRIFEESERMFESVHVTRVEHDQFHTMRDTLVPSLFSEPLPPIS